jgi:hypothetical protein
MSTHASSSAFMDDVGQSQTFTDQATARGPPPHAKLRPGPTTRSPHQFLDRSARRPRFQGGSIRDPRAPIALSEFTF